MENSKQPIYPSFTVKSQEGYMELASEESVARGRYDHGNIGLTKREYFAAQAMVGMANQGSYTLGFIVKTAVKLADELLKELEINQETGKEKENGKDI